VTRFIAAIRRAGQQSDCRLKTVGRAFAAGSAGGNREIETLALQTLSLVKLHRAGCEQCGKFESCWGNDIRRRLQELQAFEQTNPETAMPTKSFHDDAA